MIGSLNSIARFQCKSRSERDILPLLVRHIGVSRSPSRLIEPIIVAARHYLMQIVVATESLLLDFGESCTPSQS